MENRNNTQGNPGGDGRNKNGQNPPGNPKHDPQRVAQPGQKGGQNAPENPERASGKGENR